MQLPLALVSVHLHLTSDSLKCRRYFCRSLYLKKFQNEVQIDLIVKNLAT